MMWQHQAEPAIPQLEPVALAVPQVTDALSQGAQCRALVLHEADVGCQQPCIHGQAHAHDCMAPLCSCQEVVQEPKEEQQVCHDIAEGPGADGSAVPVQLHGGGAPALEHTDLAVQGVSVLQVLRQAVVAMLPDGPVTDGALRQGDRQGLQGLYQPCLI